MTWLQHNFKYNKMRPSPWYQGATTHILYTRQNLNFLRSENKSERERESDRKCESERYRERERESKSERARERARE